MFVGSQFVFLSFLFPWNLVFYFFFFFLGVAHFFTVFPTSPAPHPPPPFPPPAQGSFFFFVFLELWETRVFDGKTDLFCFRFGFFFFFIERDPVAPPRADQSL